MSSTRRFAWGPCVHMKSCSEVRSLYSAFVFFVCLITETHFNFLCVFSGPVPWSVLSLRRCGAERPVCITRTKLWEELWWLLIDYRDHLPRYCRFFYHSPTSSFFLPVSPHFAFWLFLYNLLLLCEKHFVCVFIFVFSHVCLPSRSCVYGWISSKEHWWLY